MAELSLMRLKEVLYYDPLTGHFTWLVSTSNRVKVGNKAGTQGDDGYILINIDGERFRSHRLAWMYMYGNMPDFEIDHINRIRNDNRISNLRLATSKQNKENGGLRSNNTSGHVGVSWDKTREKWMAFVINNRKFINLGRYDDLNRAINAATKGRLTYHTHYNNI